MIENSIVSVSDTMQDFIVHAGDILDGVQVVFRFPNNYGASVIKHHFSYDVELAVVKFNSEDNDDWNICYTTPITDDVLGYLSEDELYKTLIEIKSL